MLFLSPNDTLQIPFVSLSPLKEPIKVASHQQDFSFSISVQPAHSICKLHH